MPQQKLIISGYFFGQAVTSEGSFFEYAIVRSNG